MAILEEQFTETLDAGAPDITYEGSVGREQQIAQALWDKLPPQVRMQFGSFQQFFSSGAWKKMLQMLQQQMQGQEGPQEVQDPILQQEGQAVQEQGMGNQGIGSLMPQARPMGMAYGGTPGADGRRAYGIGSWFQKKIMDPIKKNPLISAAVLAGGSQFFGPTKGWMDPLLKGISGSNITKGLGSVLSKPEWMIPAASLVAGAFAKPEQALEGGAMSRGAGINLQDIAKLANITDEQQGQAIGLNFLPEASARKYSPEEMALTYSQAGQAQGGRIGYEGGGFGSYKDFIESTGDEELMELYSVGLESGDFTRLFDALKKKGYPADYAKGGRIGYADGSPGSRYTYLTNKVNKGIPLTPPEQEELQMLEITYADVDRDPSAYGGRIGAQEGGLMDLGGMEKDYRNDGGFVPLGGEEKADDVPARLSRNEFVFTADAVRNAGGGDMDRGAEVMENVMKNLEGGGEISAESQGKGAEEMFEVSERLSEVV